MAHPPPRSLLALEHSRCDCFSLTAAGCNCCGAHLHTSVKVSSFLSPLLLVSSDSLLEQARPDGVHPQEEGGEGQVQAAPGPGQRVLVITCFIE